jgi:type II secretory pathway pseudopilin PulG
VRAARKPAGPRRGAAALTLVEILVAALITLVLLGALSFAFVAGLDVQRLQKERRAALGRTEALEAHVAEVLRGAKVEEQAAADAQASDPNNANAAAPLTFFRGETTGSGDAGDLGCDRLTFTSTAPPVPMAARASADDFETQQAARGPVGGPAEVSWGVTPVGAPPDDRAGLFERVQRPSDSDPAQGGTETLLAAGVRAVGFRFWDGTQWVTAWDTTAGESRLPAAVQVNYVMEDDSDGAAPRSFVVTIPASDVDAQNPAGPETTSGGAPGL